MSFGLWNGVGRIKHKFNRVRQVLDSGGPKEAQVQSYSPVCANVTSWNWESTLVPPGQYDWTVRLLYYFDHVFVVIAITSRITRISVWRRWSLWRREEVTCYPETRGHRRDMRSDGCHGDHRSSCRHQILLGQRQRNRCGTSNTVFYTLTWTRILIVA